MQIQNWSFWARFHSIYGNVFKMTDVKFHPKFCYKSIKDISLQVFSGNSDSHSVKVLLFLILQILQPHCFNISTLTKFC